MRLNITWLKYLNCLLVLCMLISCSSIASPSTDTTGENQINVSVDVESTVSSDTTVPTEEDTSIPQGATETVAPDTEAGASGEETVQFALSDTQTVSLALALPDGWSLCEGDEATPNVDQKLYLYLVDKDKKYISNAAGEYVGAVDCMSYTVSAGNEDKPEVIFLKIALGNGYRFDIHGTYAAVTEVNRHALGTTYLTDVYYSPSFRAPWTVAEEKHNLGILSYNRDACVFAALEFERDRIDEETVSAIAQSLRWTVE